MTDITLRKYWDEIRASYWFIPTVMVLGAIVLSFVTTAIDGALGSLWMERVSWLYANKPEGARSLLSTIAGSMITVAGVTFSITIAAVAYATSEFGPRLLTNFMRDRGNQITLGTFIATFIYCLLVLRTIRNADDVPVGARGPEFVGAFVPHVSVLCGLVLALASVGVLIYFIHHIPESIHASNVVAGIGREFNDKIDQVFPEMIGMGPPEDEEYEAEEDVPDGFLEESVPIRAQGQGYVSYLDEEDLMRVSREHDLLLRLEYRPGDFVTPQKTLVLAWPRDHVSEEAEKAIRRTFAWSRKRTQAQDALFLAEELVEIAVRALSPSLNDPFTAMTCMDWLGGAFSKLAGRDLPPTYRYDEEHRLRLIAHPASFGRFTEAVFGQLRPYVKKDPNASLHMMKVIAEVVGDTENEAYRKILLHQAMALRDSCRQTLSEAVDLDRVEQRHRIIVRLVNEPDAYRKLSDRHDWLSGSA